MYLKPISVIKADLGINPDGPVQAYFTERCVRHMNRYIPYSGEGANDYHLRDNIDKGTDYITYETPYAHAQYVGYTTGPVRNYTTPRNRTILG